MFVGYIYRILNQINGKIYIGQTTEKDPFTRMNKHVKSKAGGHLQLAFAKYGVENFDFRVLKKVEHENEIIFHIHLDMDEKYYIYLFNTMDRERAYNKQEGGQGGARSPEVGQKISEAKKGHKTSDSVRKAVSESNKRRVVSEETRKKRSEAMKGRTASEESKEKISKAQKGRVVSEEARLKQKESMARRKEERQRLGLPWLDKPLPPPKPTSEETKKKISEALKGRKKSQEHIDAVKEAKKRNKGGDVMKPTSCCGDSTGCGCGGGKK